VGCGPGSVLVSGRSRLSKSGRRGSRPVAAGPRPTGGEAQAPEAPLERQATDPAQLRVLAKRLAEPVAGDPAAQMMDVMDADVRREPAQHGRQIIVRAAVQRAGVEVPVRAPLPVGVLELMLDIEQPDTGR
jgi:hypothetical protein